MNGLFTENKYYVEYETHLRHLNELMANGLGDTEEAEAVRDCMDTPWYHLTEDEAKRLRGLSADLYMLQDDEVFQASDGRTKIQIGQAVYTALDRERWEEALELMRQPNSLPRVKVAVGRASAYQALGDREAALLFLHYAMKLAPRDHILRALELDLLINGNRKEEAREKSTVLLNDVAAPAFLRIYAAGVLIQAFEYLAASHYESVVSSLEQVLRGETTTILPRSDIMAHGYEVLAYCYFKSGMVQNAYDAVEEAMRFSPSEKLRFMLNHLSQIMAGDLGASSKYELMMTQQLQTSTRLSNLDTYALAAA